MELKLVELGDPRGTMALNQLAYTDIASVRNSVGRGEGALRRAAQQFEALFVDMMLKSMREANRVFAEGSYLSSREVELHQEMLDHERSVHMANSGGLGLTEIIMRQLGGGRENARSSAVRADVPAAARVQRPGRRQAMFEGVSDFVARMLPVVQRVVGSSGLNPIGVVAQAALETGWGQRIIHDGQGQSSHNVLGVKAGDDWAGPAVSIRTLEVNGPTPRLELHAFRAYESFESAVDDYLELLDGKSRYQGVLAAQDPETFADELQRAGYATDPEYAQKIHAAIDEIRRHIPGAASQRPVSVE